VPGALEAEAEVVRRWGLRGVLSFEATERVSVENGELGLQENASFMDACCAGGGLVSGLMCSTRPSRALLGSLRGPLLWRQNGTQGCICTCPKGCMNPNTARPILVHPQWPTTTAWGFSGRTC